MRRTIQLGDLQLLLMRLLWERGEATVVDLCEAVRLERPLALTTIATMLKKMEKKGVVAHRVDGRRFVYRPAVSEAEVTRSMVAHLTRSLFGGEPAALVSHLLSTHRLRAQELSELRNLIDEAAKKEKR